VENWALYFDKDDKGLAGKVRGEDLVEIELVRTKMEEVKTEDEPD